MVTSPLLCVSCSCNLTCEHAADAAAVRMHCLHLLPCHCCAHQHHQQRELWAANLQQYIVHWLVEQPVTVQEPLWPQTQASSCAEQRLSTLCIAGLLLLCRAAQHF